MAARGEKLERPESLDDFFRPGLTWPLAASVFNVRVLPSGCIFGHKGPAIFPNDMSDTLYLGGAEFFLSTLSCQRVDSREDMGGRWEVGIVKRLPVPKFRTAQSNRRSIR